FLMADVFISYKSQNRPFTEMVAGRLRLYELSVWWDDLLRGDRADEKIQAEIELSTSVVVLLSELSVAANSDWVRGEIIRAGEKIVPVRIDQVRHSALPTPLLGRDLIELADWNGDTSHSEFRKLVARCLELKTGVRPQSVAAVTTPD